MSSGGASLREERGGRPRPQRGCKGHGWIRECLVRTRTPRSAAYGNKRHPASGLEALCVCFINVVVVVVVVAAAEHEVSHDERGVESVDLMHIRSLRSRASVLHLSVVAVPRGMSIVDTMNDK